MVDIECGSDAGKGLGQLALEDETSDGVGYFRGGVRFLSRGGEGGYFFRQVLGFTEPSMKIGAVNVFDGN